MANAEIACGKTWARRAKGGSLLRREFGVLDEQEHRTAIVWATVIGVGIADATGDHRQDVAVDFIGQMESAASVSSGICCCSPSCFICRLAWMRAGGRLLPVLAQAQSQVLVSWDSVPRIWACQDESLPKESVPVGTSKDHRASSRDNCAELNLLCQ